MDSNNSGSMQSSSVGEDEYDDTRDELISGFLNTSGQVCAMPNTQSPSNHQYYHPSSLFNQPTSFLDSSRQSHPPTNANSLRNFDMVWSTGLVSQPNRTEMLRQTGPSSSRQLITGAQGSNQVPFTSTPSVYLPPESENGELPPTSSQQPKAVRNPRKRSRASRRAPTTVLTTDTSNFRAMVQEFTGIPAPPFPAPSFPRSRLDLFNTGFTARSGISSFLSQPLAQRIQPSSFERPSFSSSAVVDAIASSSTIQNTSNQNSNTITTASANVSNNSSSTTSIHNKLPSALGLKQTEDLNSIFSFQSLRQSPPSKYPFANVPSLVAKSQEPLSIPSNDPVLKLREMEGIRMSHGNVNANTHHTRLPSPVFPEGALATRDNNTLSWGVGAGLNDRDQVCLQSRHRSNDNSQKFSNSTMRYSSTSSDVNGERGSENVSSRGEGMVDSWICSAD